MTLPSPLVPPARVLLGPGPSDVAPSVSRALAAPTVGHLDPYFLGVMDEVRAMLREVFGTKNVLTMPMSGTGSAGMETLFVNLVEPGDRVLVGIHGVFGGRMAEVARRCGAEVVTVNVPWGQPLDVEKMREAAKGQSFDVVAMVHAETSTGVLTPLAPFRALADELGAMLLVDAVTSLGGVSIGVDEHGVDGIYSGTQKCLSCPPGLAPVSLSERAWTKLKNRKTKPQSWYLDLELIGSYWGSERAYHHTAPINMLYGIHEALRLALEEGLPARFERHVRHAKALTAGLEALGLELPVPEASRLPPLTLVAIPEGIEDAPVRKALLERYGIEIGGGLGDFKGRAWRIGLMGTGSTPRNVLLCLGALHETLAGMGWKAKGDPIAAAAAVLG
ncbi:MAG: alanine--glyoxylate aminotransferase family protein [Sandaracinus sp.]|nr:alanine--glyoxylate aminotransferase family protein [Myxococcales bacterium]MCB9614891.1 alanine--glyoxylate aminotransferase family protein [Sandaracinus sp.]MCB9618643.1 alanine--glyoxylate aminotransferase family protein [Sandaracinus sp.]MCB9632576.1 alanine--glyoxylate aminotransferase family protein [Sandaracinus sp.]